MTSETGRAAELAEGEGLLVFSTPRESSLKIALRIFRKSAANDLDMPDAHLSIAEVARRLAISRVFAYQLVRTNIGFVQHGDRAMRVPPELLDRYLKGVTWAGSSSDPTQRATSPSSKTTAARGSGSRRTPPTAKRPKLRSVGSSATPSALTVHPVYPRTKPRTV
ncbi:MAG: helix-turn-helix domain-containing protein [Polyangia bacterium]